MERTGGNCGSLKQLVAARMRMTHRAEVARRKEHGLQTQGKDDIAPRTPEGRRSKKKCWKGPEFKIGVKNPVTRRQLRLKIERTSEGIDRIGVRIASNRDAQRVAEKEELGLVEGSAPPERKIKDWALWMA
jgi:hypothetical protein